MLPFYRQENETHRHEVLVWAAWLVCLNSDVGAHLHDVPLSTFKKNSTEQQLRRRGPVLKELREVLLSRTSWRNEVRPEGAKPVRHTPRGIGTRS